MDKFTTNDLLMEVARRYCVANGLPTPGEEWDCPLTMANDEFFEAFNVVMEEVG